MYYSEYASQDGYSGVRTYGTLQGTASTTPPINGNASGVVSERCPSTSPFPISPPHFRPHAYDKRNDAAGEVFSGPRQGDDGRCSTPGAEDPVEATQARGAHPLEQGPG